MDMIWNLFEQDSYDVWMDMIWGLSEQDYYDFGMSRIWNLSEQDLYDFGMDRIFWSEHKQDLPLTDHVYLTILKIQTKKASKK